MESSSLISVDQAEGLSILQVWQLYEAYVNSSQVALLKRFGAGRATVSRAEGSRIFLKDGREILDLTGGIGVLNHGHNHPEILAAREQYARARKMEVHKNFLSPYIAALSHNVASILPGDLSVSYFANSGAEAVEGAVKLAFKFHKGERRKILTSNLSFHGKLLGAGSLTQSPELHFAFPEIPGVTSFVYNDFDSVMEIVKSSRREDGSSDIYALIIEPLNVSSMTFASEDFLLKIRNLCEEEGIILIFDEVYSGWGKTGHLFNFMRVSGLVPDILVYAKSFGGGKASISGYTSIDSVARRSYDNLLDATLHSTTYNGFGEETATAIKAIEIAVRDDFPTKARVIGEKFSAGIGSGIESGIVRNFRGSGGIWGINFSTPKSASFVARLGNLVPSKFLRDKGFVEKLIAGSAVNFLFEKHGILSYFGSNFSKPLIISFPLISDSEDVNQAVRAVLDLNSQPIERLLVDFVRDSSFRKVKV